MLPISVSHSSLKNILNIHKNINRSVTSLLVACCRTYNSHSFWWSGGPCRPGTLFSRNTPAWQFREYVKPFSNLGPSPKSFLFPGVFFSPHSAWLAPNFASFSLNVIFEMSSVTYASSILHTLFFLTPSSPLFFSRALVMVFNCMLFSAHLLMSFPLTQYAL